MRINKTDNTNFGSHFALNRKLSLSESRRFMNDFEIIINPHSPFSTDPNWMNGIKSVISVLDKNDGIVEKYLEKIGVTVKKKTQSFRYYSKMFNFTDDKNQAKRNADGYINRFDWKVPQGLIDK